MTKSAEFIASDPNVVLQLLLHATDTSQDVELVTDNQNIELTVIVAKAVKAWLRHDPDGSRAALKDPLVAALRLRPVWFCGIVPDTNTPQRIAQEEHLLQVMDHPDIST